MRHSNPKYSSKIPHTPNTKGILDNFFASNCDIILKMFDKKSLPFKIASIYTVLGTLWILLSDKLLNVLITNRQTMLMVQTLKGWLFVLISALVLYALIYMSISAIQRSQDELKAREELYRLAISGTTEGPWDWCMETNDLFLSDRLKVKLGYEERELENNLKTWLRLVHPDDIKRIKQMMNNYLNGILPQYKVEFRLKSKNGRYLWFITKGLVVAYNGSKPSRMVGTITDITERKMTERALKDAMEENEKLLDELVEYDKLKTEFFANISHEFRTPLNVILGTIQLISKYNNPNEPLSSYMGKIHRYNGIMKQNCYRLLRLINNLIDITRIDSGFLDAQMKNNNIIEVIEQVTLSVTELTESKSISLTFDTETEEKIMAFDEDKIERVMLNLLSNAVKYTNPGGSITVNIFDRDDHILISVKDTGIGIPQEKIHKIFERFTQVNSSFTRNNEGSGIGLSLVKSLIWMHDGDIKVESKLGKGSEFIIKLPTTLIPDGSPASSNYMSGGDRVERARIEFSDIYINN